MGVLQFVESIAASPTLRLDLNDQTNYFLHDSPDFSPPNLRRVEISSMLKDGASIPISAYENRIIKVVLTVKGTGGTPKEDLGTRLQNLARELDRPANILKWKATGAASGKEVFFRTIRSPDFAFDFGLPGSRTDALSECEVSLDIIAEPFAIGLRVDQGAITVNNDPAAGTNPCRFDVTGVTGDVPTPLFLRIDPSASAGVVQIAMATRRHGTPTGVYPFQAEALTQGTDTSVQTTDAAASGATNNWSRTTFATDAAMRTRLTIPTFPASGYSADYRGAYRCFARVKKPTSGDVVDMRMFVGGASGFQVGDKVRIEGVADSAWAWFDLGTISLPISVRDPETEGYSGAIQPVYNTALEFQAQRVSGTGNFDWDAFLFLPASEELLIFESIPQNDIVIDGPLDVVYTRLTTGIMSDVTNQSQIKVRGDIPKLVPGQTTRIGFLQYNQTITATASLIVSFWPLFLDVVRS